MTNQQDVARWLKNVKNYDGQIANHIAKAITPILVAAKEAMESAIIYDKAIRSCSNDPKKMASFCSAQGKDLDTLYNSWIYRSTRALAKLKEVLPNG